MKHVVFVSQSKLAQNMMEIIIRSIPKKIKFKTCDSLDDLSRLASTPAPLIIIDANTWQAAKLKIFSATPLTLFKKVLIHPRAASHLRQTAKEYGIHDFLVKPFLAEEIITLLYKILGYKA